MTQTNFIPEGYKVPTANSNYMKIQEGDNKFRILSSQPFIFYKYFTTSDKPVIMAKLPEEMPNDIKPNKFTGSKDIDEMWALVVLDYADGKVKILDFPQVSIKNRLFELNQDADYGNPTNYDLKITKAKDAKGKTVYTTTPLLKSAEVPETARKMVDTIVLTDMAVTGGNPFKNFKAETFDAKPGEDDNSGYPNQFTSSKEQDTGNVRYPDEDINPEDIPF